MAKQPDTFSLIDKALTGETKNSLSRWMRQNNARLSERIQGHQTDWNALIAVLAPLNLRDRFGRPPSAKTAQKAYERARREARKHPQKPIPTQRTPDAPRSPSSGFSHKPVPDEAAIRKLFGDDE